MITNRYLHICCVNKGTQAGRGCQRDMGLDGMCAHCMFIYAINIVNQTKSKYHNYFSLFPFLFSIFAQFHNIFFKFIGHLSHSGDLLLWVGVRRRASFVVR